MNINVYYQNYGFEHYKDGKRVQPHLGWINDSLKGVQGQVSKAIIDKVSREIDSIF